MDNCFLRPNHLYAKKINELTNKSERTNKHSESQMLKKSSLSIILRISTVEVNGTAQKHMYQTCRTHECFHKFVEVFE